MSPGMGREVMLKHFSLDHKWVILDNDDAYFEDMYRDDEGNLHVRVSLDSAGSGQEDARVESQRGVRSDPHGEGDVLLSRSSVTSRKRWFAWANRHGFGFRLGRVEVQVYFYGGGFGG